MKLLKRYKLQEKYTIEQLVKMQETEQSQKAKDEIAHAIQLHLIEKKKANGTFVFAGGYSGRQTKK